MSLFIRGRTALRAAAVVTVTATSLVGASTASAGLDNAKKPAFPTRPNLVSLTLSQSTNATNATFTFDKPIGFNTGANASDFSVFGYDEFGGDTVAAAGTPVRTGNSVTVALATRVDPNQVTGGTVQPDAVTAGSISGVQQTNIADSIAVTGARGEEGTRGHTVAPDLVSVRNSGSNTLTYTFDEDLATAPLATNFLYVDSAGKEHSGNSVTISGPDAIVQFAPSDTVVTGHQASVRDDAVSNAFNDLSAPANATIAGQTDTTDAPVLVSAEMVGANQIRFTYKQAVTTPDAAMFRGVLSNGDNTIVKGTSAVVNGNTVLVTFASFDNYREFLVAAADVGGGIKSTTQAGNPPANVPSPPSGVPIGGNAGAKATGYTTAPDGVAAAFGGNNVTVTLDARLSGVTVGNFQLLDASGGTSDTASAANATLNGAPGPTQVNVTFGSANSVANAGAIMLKKDAVEGTDPAKSQNVLQTIGR